MAFKVVHSEQASVDLDDIIGYIHDELHSPQAAKKFFNKAMETIKLLCDNPYIFPLYHDDTLNAEGYRFAMIGNHMMFYTVDNDAEVVNIARIIYGRRNIPVVFGSNK
jgi:plasmid stabilization system protein ParE